MDSGAKYTLLAEPVWKAIKIVPKRVVTSRNATSLFYWARDTRLSFSERRETKPFPVSLRWKRWILY